MIGWFRKLFRRRPPPAPPPSAPTTPPMHWVPAGNTRAVCGERRPARWTMDGRWASCKVCKREWGMVGLKKFLNER